MKNPTFVNDEYYHIYNRGADKRTIFECQKDLDRFFQSMDEFNVIDPIGSIYENSLSKSRNIKQTEKFGNRIPKLFKSSWEEYIKNNNESDDSADGHTKKEKEHFCEKNIILDQFGNTEDYKRFAEESLERIKENKNIKSFLLE